MSTDPNSYLFASVSGYIDLMDTREARERVAKYPFIAGDAARLIGRMANSLAVAGFADEALRLADDASARLGIFEPDARFSLWYQLHRAEPEMALSRMYKELGILPPDRDDAKTSLEQQDLGKTMTLLELGDQRAVAVVRDMVVNAPDEYAISNAARYAVKLFKADPGISVDFVCEAAQRARDYLLEQTPDSEPDSDNDGDPLQQLAHGIASALSPSRSPIERAYAQTDIALRYFAEERIRLGDIESADRLQALMISPFYSAELSSVRVAERQDVGDRHAEATMYYLGTSGVDNMYRSQEIVCNLIRGGYQPAIDQASTVLLDENVPIDPEEVSADLLAELYNAGNPEAYKRLMQLYPYAGARQWEYPQALEKMGMHDLAGKLLRSRFGDNDSFENGLAVLSHEFDMDTWLAIQGTIDRRTQGDVLRVIEDRVRAVELLARYLRDIKDRDA